jgi:amidase
MVAGVRLTFGSTILADNVADQDDYMVGHLRDAGIVITGKTATPEFGLPCYTETKIGPPARTPWDLTRSAGGSSGGAAAAVSSGLAPAAQGSDGGGSIRIPASVCGLFGIKPTRGRISQGPMMPDLTGLSIDGPLARTVADAALLLDAMTGNHPGDMYTLPALAPGDSFLGYASREPGKLRIARSVETVVPGAGVDPECVAAYEDASRLLESLGHEVEDLVMPFAVEAVPSFLALWYAMATLAPISPEQESQLLPLTRYLRGKGMELSAADLLLHQAILQGATRPAMAAMNAYDAILTPTLAMPPRPVGWFDEVEPEENFIRQTLFTPWTALYNLSGQPAVNVPLHWSDDGLPIGVMLAGRMGAEGTLISLSAQLESARPWKDKHPAIWGQ